MEGYSRPCVRPGCVRWAYLFRVKSVWRRETKKGEHRGRDREKPSGTSFFRPLSLSPLACPSSPPQAHVPLKALLAVLVRLARPPKGRVHRHCARLLPRVHHLLSLRTPNRPSLFLDEPAYSDPLSCTRCGCDSQTHCHRPEAQPFTMNTTRPAANCFACSFLHQSLNEITVCIGASIKIAHHRCSRHRRTRPSPLPLGFAHATDTAGSRR